jgi:hypothetical protein
MTTGDWIDRARQFLNADLERLRGATTEAERRTAIMDIHATLDNVFRSYLSAEHGAQEILDKGGTSFPKVVRLLHQYAGNVADEETVEELTRFNQLRNSVVHEQLVPTDNDVARFAQCASTILKRLLGQHRGRPRGLRGRSSRTSQSQWAPPTLPKWAGCLCLAASTILAAFSALYWLLPDLLPLNPVDDIIIGCPLMALAGILVIATLVTSQNRRRSREAHHIREENAQKSGKLR